MKNILSIVLLAQLFSISPQAFAYKEGTHEQLSRVGTEFSILANEQTLKNLGVEPGKPYPDSNGNIRNIKELIQTGANFEDTLASYRAINHFFNPLNGSGLTGVSSLINNPSPNWALEDRGSVSLQDYSFRDAREYFFKALTEKGKNDRDKNFGLTFQTIGMVIHHIQDMAQPQHVRNDAHLEHQYIPKSLENPSLYEQFTNRDDVRPFLPVSGYPAVYSDADTNTFNKPRYLWEKTTGAGLAQFTNRNFVSAGTNFDKPGLFGSPMFDPTKRLDVTVEDLCLNAIPRCPAGIRGGMTFYGTTVSDGYTNWAAPNPLASTESLFSADLERRVGKKAFTLNRFNFLAAHGFLIPRAVGYSAGLINYFFRGKLDFVPDPDHPGKYIIKNQGGEDMTGTFALYYDDKDKDRHAWKRASWDLSVAANAQSEAVELPTDLSPEIKDPRKYMLVFKGDMGEEVRDGDLGAVVGHQVNDPLVLTAMGALFAVNTANQFNPLTTYFMNVDFKSADLNDEVWKVLRAAKQVTIRVNGQNWPTTAWSAGEEGGFYAHEETFPYREFDFRVKNRYRFSLDLDNQPTQSADIVVLVDNVPLLSYTFSPTSEAAPVFFKKAFHLIADPNGVKFDWAIYLDVFGEVL